MEHAINITDGRSLSVIEVFIVNLFEGHFAAYIELDRVLNLKLCHVALLCIIQQSPDYIT